MKKITRVSTVLLSIALVFSLAQPTAVFAAAAPALGVATGYSVFGNAGITETPAQLSRLWGNAGGNGLGHASLIASQVTGTIDAGANPPVVAAISAAYGALAGEAQTGAIDLAASPTVAPGVYDVAATAFNSTLTLNGAGVYIFRSTSSIAQTAGGTMLLTNGATACNVFWQIPTSMTFSAPGSIVGTIITNTGLISFVSGLNLQGRAWAATQVTMNNNQITEPTCAVAPSSGSNTGTMNVVKTVINDSGGTKVVADFPLFVDGTLVISGVANTFPAGPVFTVTETSNSGYTTTFSGQCDATGQFSLSRGDNKLCIITNNDIGLPLPVVPPLIDVIKVPNPLALPGGPGPVTYTYKVTNPGAVALSNIKIVDDKCSPVKYISGDINGNVNLNINETWVYTCRIRLTQTTVNTVTVEGVGNGLTARDAAIVTVVVSNFIPKLPTTGFGPDEKSMSSNVVIPLGIFAVGLLLYFSLRKQTA